MIDIEEIYNTKVDDQIIAIGIDDAIIYTTQSFEYLYMLTETSGFRTPKTIGKLQSIFNMNKDSIQQWEWEYEKGWEFSTGFLLRYRDMLSNEEIETLPQWFMEDMVIEELLK